MSPDPRIFFDGCLWTNRVFNAHILYIPYSGETLLQREVDVFRDSDRRRKRCRERNDCDLLTESIEEVRVPSSERIH